MLRAMGLLLLLTACATSAPRDNRGPASVVDADDANILTIYAKQGYLANGTYRDLVPLSSVEKLINPAQAKTCAQFITSEHAHAGAIPYYDKILIFPGGEAPTLDMKLYYLLSDVLDKLPPFIGTTYRGVPSCEHLEEEDGFKAMFVDRGFTSTSARKESAEVFTHTANDDGSSAAPKGCLITINGKSGRRIADLTGNYNNEQEVLFPARMAFRISDGGKDGGRQLVNFTEIDPKSTSPDVATWRAGGYVRSVQTYFPTLNPQTGSALEPDRSNFNQLAEKACQAAYRFFTPDPAMRAKINAADPIFDLKNKKMKAEDFEFDD